MKKYFDISRCPIIFSLTSVYIKRSDGKEYKYTKPVFKRDGDKDVKVVKIEKKE